MREADIGGDNSVCRAPVARRLCSSAAVRIRIDDPAALPDLVEELSRRIDLVITEVNDDEVELWLLGSLATSADRAEMEERLRNRHAARHAKVWIIDEDEV